jgi:hypothetical protein
MLPLYGQVSIYYKLIQVGDLLFYTVSRIACLTILWDNAGSTGTAQITS